MEDQRVLVPPYSLVLLMLQPVVVEWDMMEFSFERCALIAYCMYFQRGSGRARYPAQYNTALMGQEPLEMDDKTRRLFNLSQAIKHNGRHDDPVGLSELRATFKYFLLCPL